MSKLKHSYTPSKNEFVLIMGLIGIAIIALCANYLIFPQWSALRFTLGNYDREKIHLENLRTEYASLDSYLEKDAELTAELIELELVVPTYLSEEEILSAVDTLSSSSGLDVLGLTFSGVTTEGKSSFLSTLKLSAAGGAAAAQTAQTGAAPSDSASYIQSERVSVSYSGSYEDLTSFLSAFESETRQVYFRNAALTRTENGELSGNLTMLVFSNRYTAPVPNDPNYPGYDYTAPMASGKSDPFAAFPGYEGAPAAPAAAVQTPDFYIILNTYDDNSNKILMGKYPVSSTQITSNGNRNLPASLTLSKSGNQCRYRYKLDDQTYSGSFTLDSSETVLSVSVLSRARKSSLDNVGITLSVQNNTGLSLNINVKNDDTSHPRFVLGTTTGRVQVVK